MRPDVWWTQPLFVFLGWERSSSIRPGPRSRQRLLFRAVPFAILFPEIFGGATPHSWFGRKPDWCLRGCFFHQRSSCCGSRWISPDVLLLSGAYYKAFWLIRRHAPSVNRARRISASVPSRLSCRMCTVIFCTSRSSLFSFSHMMRGRRCGSPIPQREKRFRNRSRHARPDDQCRVLGGYTFGCHSLRHLVGGFLDQFSKSPSVIAPIVVGCLNQSTCFGLDEFVLGRVFGCLRPALRARHLARLPIFLGPHRMPNTKLSARRFGYRKPVVPGCARRLKRPPQGFGRNGFKVSPGQGAYRHGRGRNRGGSRQCRRAR